MEQCLVCFEDDGCKTTRIYVSSNEWTKQNMLKIIEKHLWWWYPKSSRAKKHLSSDDFICIGCWSLLASFNLFYNRVKKVHNSYHMNNVGSYLTDKMLEQKSTSNNPAPNPTLEELCMDVNIETNSQAIDILDTVDILEDCFFNESSEESSLREDVGDSTRPNVNNVKEFPPHPNVSLSDKSTSSAKLIQQYDKFIAANHDLFCSVCHVPISDFQALIIHFRDEHATRAYAMCCGKKFYKRAVFVDHLCIHKDPEYFKCQHCAKVLSNRRCLKNHLEWHDESREPKFKCNVCGKQFFKRGSYEKHKLLHVPEEERHFECQECKKKFASESLRTQHYKVTHLNKYAKICDICGKPFRERHSFQRHLSEHTGMPVELIQCDICGMKLTSTYGLNRHKRLRHMQENMKEQKCPYCSKMSPNIAAHRSHIQYSHTMQRKHACHLCDKAFRRPKELKEHLSTHTGKALYTCPHCPRTFISNANMHKHRKNEHPKEWEEARLQRLGSL